MSPIITDLERHDVTKYTDCKARSTRLSLLILTRDVAQPAVSRIRKQLCGIEIVEKSLLVAHFVPFVSQSVLLRLMGVNQSNTDRH